jgi:hypothetical protein
MNLCDNSKSLIISINLCNIKNMIHPSDLELNELSSLFSRRDLRDSSFQDTTIKVLCLGKSFLNLIKENHGLHQVDEIAEHMIPTTFNEETEFLSDSNLNSLKLHYMTFYWKVIKDFLDYIEDSMPHDSLIGSTISTRSKKNVSYASNISSPSILSHDSKVSKVSETDNPHDFYPKNFNHAFLPKPDFEGYRNNAKKEFEENQNYLGEELHQDPDNPSTFMKMVKKRTRTMAAVNDERRQVSPSKFIWDGTIDRFEVFRNNVEGHYGKIGAGYLFDSSFQEAYLERGVDCYVDFLDEVPSASQIKKDAFTLYGTLLGACQGGVGRRILMENRDKTGWHSFMVSVSATI